MTDGRDKVTWERHTQTVLALLVTALLVWVGSTTQQTAVAIAELKAEISFMRQTRQADRLKLSNIDSRLSAVERELAALRKQLELHDE